MLQYLCSLIILLHYYGLTEAKIYQSSDNDLEERQNDPPWDYGENGPSTWSNNYPDCAGKNQSPIAINQYQNQNLGPLKFYGYSTQKTGWILVNKGYTVELELPEGDTDTPYIEGGGLGAKYYFTQLHFHWGLNNTSGAEHKRRENFGRTLEMHIVHSNPEERKDGQAGIAVLGQMFEAMMTNRAYQPITNAMRNVINKGEKTTINESFALDSLIPRQSRRNSFFRYNGSLTTPPCTEGVIWTLFTEFSYIGNEQMVLFRNLRRTSPGDPNPQPIAPNFRPVQDLNDRTIFRNRR